MALLALVIAILIERYYHSNQSATRDKLSSDNWYFSYSRGLNKTFGDKSWYQGWLRDSVEIFIPAIVIFILFKLFDDGFIASLIVLALMVLILVHAFGPQLPSKQLSGYFSALEHDDPQAAYEYAKTYTGKEANDEAEMVKQVTSSIFYNVESQYFSVAIWFVLLGPAGALLYRMLLWQQQESRLGVAGKKVFYVMEWIACRISTLSYLLAGDMAHGIDAIKKQYFDLDVSGKDLLLNAAAASMGAHAESYEKVAGENHCAIGVSQRAGVILFAVIAVASLLGWTFV
ncbi:regulatory signaling modulator protein AmpE [Kangiella shandongensis]|uniref:regulatory signaling modulator protein AmpE n=1 Tax=Kangiella shandongensis TaxID=2763258 RepID=UPI001CBEFC0A|nr:regulatory signaling modulator protein AmpE [Kangiella shandongensis]